MRQLMTGGILLVWGLGILLNRLLTEPVPSDGAYQAGARTGLVIAVVLVAAGGYTLLKAAAARRAS